MGARKSGSTQTYPDVHFCTEYELPPHVTPLIAVPIARPLPSISAGAARVAKELANIKGSQVESQHNLEIAVRDLSILEEQEKDLRKEVERVEGKKEWVEGFRGWVEMLGGFLEEKVSCGNGLSGGTGLTDIRCQSSTTSRRTRCII